MVERKKIAMQCKGQQGDAKRKAKEGSITCCEKKTMTRLRVILVAMRD